ncbi:tetratricopeptide repeat protein 7B-like isoform X3 [Varroa destructor]|uniref:Tetratricopeptide repeat protein 7 N-terminal domain-containing protein n=1 Tax=Varroa destructor TaxID=109461 RepID=A0A7M7MED1_VARDE|nr:tetratricopeptide repeat protein 7B-like isoform X3 [Varroa destructor]
MASRTASKAKGLDSEIYRYRDESNWRKLQETAEQLRQRASAMGNSAHLANLLIGEAKLEMYLEENPPVENNISKARTSLTEAKRYLSDCTKSDAEKSNVATDARFLLAKCCYAQGQYEQALEHLDQVVEKSQGLQGAVVQLTPGGIPAFGGVGGGSTEFRIGILLETALQRAPILMMKSGQIREAVEQYRGVLRAQETTSTQSLRMTLARQLAEVLLRGVSEHEWQQIQPRQQQLERSKAGKYWRPQVYSGGSLYVPREHIEEILLLLALSDAIAVRNVVLDRSADVASDRAQSIKNVTAVLDLLSIALARNAQFGLLCENFEKVAKFSCDEYHIWNQFGLCLISAGSHYRGVQMLLESAKLRPKYGFDLLLAAKVTLVNLCDAPEALRLVEEASSREKVIPDSDILVVCYTLQALCHEALADEAACIRTKEQQRIMAFKALVQARQVDPDYPQAEYLMSLHYANLHQIDAAMVCAKRALCLAPDFFPGVQLLIVLLTAQKKHEEALELVQLTLEEYPNNLNLLYLKVYLEDYLEGPQKALHTAGEMLKQWKVLYENYLKVKQATQANGLAPPAIGTSSQLGIVPVAHAHSGRASVVGSGQWGGGPWHERDGDGDGSLMTRLDRSLSETLARLTPCGRRVHVDELTLLQMQMHVWLLTARLYIKMAHFPEAEQSISEASNVIPLSPHVLLVRGLLHEARGEWLSARDALEGSLAVRPHSVTALQHLGLVYHQLGSHQLAEATLQSAALIEPMSPTTWFYLGRILQESGTPFEASECLETAVQLELCAPVLEFSKLPRTL